MVSIKKDAITGRILVVDDIESNRDALSRRLIRHGHVVEIACDGQAALDAISTEDYDLILLDIMMPKISGLDVLEIVRKTKPAESLPIIMATGKSQSEDVVKALELGANDYVTKPLNFPVVRARVQTQLSLKKAHDELALINERMKQSLAAAAAVQQAGLPTEVPQFGGYQFAWQCRPCDELGGDGLNVIIANQNQTIFCLWDVSGHGVPAALLSVSISHILSDQAGDRSIIYVPGSSGRELASPRDIALQLNAVFPMMRSHDLFFTICYGILDRRTGEFRYVCAGQDAPLIVRRDGAVVSKESSGMPIGIADESIPLDSYQESVLQLNPGDRFYLYSDGLTEQANSDGHQFGSKRLNEICAAVQTDDVETAIEKIVGDLQQWNDGESFTDDVSILAVHREE